MNDSKTKKKLSNLSLSSENNIEDIITMDSNDERLDKYLYFPVPMLKLGHMYDWQHWRTTCPTHQVSSRPKKVSGENDVGIARLESPIHQTYRSIATQINGQSVALFRYGNRVFAVQDKCPHAGSPLHLGDIEDLAPINPLLSSPCIRCPLHKWKFDLQSGHVVHPKGKSEILKIYPVRVDFDGSIRVGFPFISPSLFNSFEF